MKYLYDACTLEKLLERLHTFKNNFGISLFVIKEDHKQTAVFDCYKYGVCISHISINSLGL